MLDFVTSVFPSVVFAKSTGSLDTSLRLWSVWFRRSAADAQPVEYAATLLRVGLMNRCLLHIWLKIGECWLACGIRDA